MKFIWKEEKKKADTEEILINGLFDRNLKLYNEDLARAPSDVIQSALMRNFADKKMIAGKSFEEALLEKYKILDMGNRDLNFSNFEKSKLQKIRFDRSNLKYANLQGTILNGSIIINSHLDGSDMRRSHLKRVNLNGSHLKGADLRGAFLNGSHLKNSNLTNAKLWKAHLVDANLTEANLSNANLSNANLSNAKLWRAHLKGANLYEAHLEGSSNFAVRFGAAELSWARFEGADLKNAFLEGSNLFEAHLEGANLEKAHLEGSNLHGAHLEGVNLYGVHSGVLSEERIKMILNSLEKREVPLSIWKIVFQIFEFRKNMQTNFGELDPKIRIRHSRQEALKDLPSLSEKENREMRRQALRSVLCKHPAIIKRALWRYGNVGPDKLFQKDEVHDHVSKECPQHLDIFDEYAKK